MDYKNLNYGLL
uniref:Uncharacterized protein n=1 Tax=Arundo donax TaxID=35708 RepID=A0A0A8ZTN5_ARUDO